MIGEDFHLSKAFRNFENIKESIKGLFEILNITLSEEENKLFYDMAVENLESVYKNFLELLLNKQGINELINKMNDSELEIDIILNDLLIKEKEEEI